MDIQFETVGPPNPIHKVANEVMSGLVKDVNENDHEGNDMDIFLESYQNNIGDARWGRVKYEELKTQRQNNEITKNVYLLGLIALTAKMFGIDAVYYSSIKRLYYSIILCCTQIRNGYPPNISEFFWGINLVRCYFI
jgi:hypothetical protein